MRNWLVATLLGCFATSALAQRAPSPGLITELQLCRVGDASGTNVAVEIVGDAVRTMIVRQNDGTTDIYDFTPVQGTPGRSVEMLAYRASAFPNHGAGRFQIAELAPSGTITLSRWDFQEGRAPTAGAVTLRCAAPR
jgi:hypothetical protein